MNQVCSTTYHARSAGILEYPPVTIRNVPKYLAPIEALETLIANPMRQSESPANTNGDRIWIRSDQIPQLITVIARMI